MEMFVLVRYSKKSGKIDKTLTGLGSALLKLWALQNTTSSKECLVFSAETGKVIYHTVGRKDDMPVIQDYELGHISEYCEGLLEAFQVA